LLLHEQLEEQEDALEEARGGERGARKDAQRASARVHELEKRLRDEAEETLRQRGERDTDRKRYADLEAGRTRMEEEVRRVEGRVRELEGEVERLEGEVADGRGAMRSIVSLLGRVGGWKGGSTWGEVVEGIERGWRREREGREAESMRKSTIEKEVVSLREELEAARRANQEGADAKEAEIERSRLASQKAAEQLRARISELEEDAGTLRAYHRGTRSAVSRMLDIVKGSPPLLDRSQVKTSRRVSGFWGLGLGVWSFRVSGF
jgi:chromosome segregation ATPase